MLHAVSESLLCVASPTGGRGGSACVARARAEQQADLVGVERLALHERAREADERATVAAHDARRVAVAVGEQPAHRALEPPLLRVAARAVVAADHAERAARPASESAIRAR